jgi:hypothetical protein
MGLLRKPDECSEMNDEVLHRPYYWRFHPAMTSAAEHEMNKIVQLIFPPPAALHRCKNYPAHHYLYYNLS